MNLRGRLPLWTAGLLAAALAVMALIYFPLELLITCGLLLIVALVWRSRSSRALGSGLMPIAVVWGAVGALVLSVGAVAARTVIPGLELPSAASASPGAFGSDDPSAGQAQPASSPAASPSSTISVHSAEPAQHLTQASVPQATVPAAPPQGGAAAQPAAPVVPLAPPPAATVAPQPASTAPPAAAAAPPPAAAQRPSSSAPATSAPASTPAASPSQTAPKQDCVAPLSGLVSVKVCG